MHSAPLDLSTRLVATQFCESVSLNFSFSKIIPSNIKASFESKRIVFVIVASFIVIIKRIFAVDKLLPR